MAELVISLLEVKQVGRFFSSDGGDVEGVLANLLIFLECSDSYYYIDKGNWQVLQYVLNRFKL